MTLGFWFGLFWFVMAAAMALATVASALSWSPRRLTRLSDDGASAGNQRTA